MKTGIIYAAFCGFIIFIAGCREETMDVHGSYTSLDAFMNAKKPQTQFYSVNAVTGGTVTGDQGSVLTFPPSAFSHADGSPVTGTVQIALQEIFSNADMIFSGVLPQSFGSLLNSGGECFIGISQAGEDLMIAEGQHYTLQIPAQTFDEDMQLFSGRNYSDTIQWSPVTYSFDSLNTYDFFTYNSLDETYSLLTDSLGWLNCDAFSGEPLVSCNIKISGLDVSDMENVIFYGIADELHSVFNFWGTYTIEGDIINIHENATPAIDVHILVIAIIDGDLYFDISPFSFEDGGEYSLTVHAGTETGLDAAIDAL